MAIPSKREYFSLHFTFSGNEIAWNYMKFANKLTIMYKIKYRIKRMYQTVQFVQKRAHSLSLSLSLETLYDNSKKNQIKDFYTKTTL